MALLFRRYISYMVLHGSTPYDMADETANLATAAQETEGGGIGDERSLQIPALDEVIEQWIGNFGWSQLIQSILVAIPRLLDRQQTFITVFTDSEPSWHCVDYTICSRGGSTTSTNPCTLPKSAWNWDGPASRTVISEWGLQCANPLVQGLPASSYFLGSVIGLFVLASLGDSSLGRKNLLLLSCLVMSVASLTTVFSTNIWMYTALKFLSGLGRASIGTSSLVLLTEKVGKRWRGRVSVMGFLFFTLGYLSLPFIAYICEGSSWRILYLCTSLPAIFHCALLYFYASESPRWLFMQGRKEEAVAVLKRIRPLTDQSPIRRSLVQVKEEESGGLTADNWNNNSFYPSPKSLMERKWAVERILIVMSLGFDIGMVYYGIPLGVGNLGFNIYLSVMFNALLEIPSYVFTLLLTENCTRRTSLLGLCILSGLFSITCVLIGNQIDKIVKIWLEIASLFSAVTAFNMLLTYTVELFPTCARKSAASMVSQALNFGAVFSPLLVSAGRRYNMTSCLMVFLDLLLFAVGSLWLLCRRQRVQFSVIPWMNKSNWRGSRVIRRLLEIKLKPVAFYLSEIKYNSLVDLSITCLNFVESFYI